MIKLVTSEKYKAILYTVSNLYDYFVDQDIYVPKYSAISGEAMRDIMAGISGYELGIGGESDGKFLVSNSTYSSDDDIDDDYDDDE